MDVKNLTPAQCVLLAVHLASESNIKALHSFTPGRLDALDPVLILRILLTYLPEAVDPSEYTSYVGEVASRLYLDFEREDVEVNISAVKDISDEQAQKRVKKLHLVRIEPPNYPQHAPQDALTRFVCHRAHRIDEQTGLLTLLPSLIEPFLDRNDFLRSWYISTVLPMLRLELEYYPEQEFSGISLVQFEGLEGGRGVDYLLKPSYQDRQVLTHSNSLESSHIGRDVKGLVGPWMYGYTERKRRKLGHERHQERPSNNRSDDKDDADDVGEKIHKISLAGVTEDDKTGHDWEYFYEWMIKRSSEDGFDLISRAIQDWDGPGDVDLGGFEHGGAEYLDESTQAKLELQYAQAAFASCYAAKADSQQTIRSAHAILARLAELLDFIPPPDLAASVESLPQIDRHTAKFDKSHSINDFAPDALLRPENPLTTPRLPTYMLLQMFVYSAYQFDGLGHPFSLVNVAQVHFYATEDEQIDVLRKILCSLVKTGTRKDDHKWIADRAKLLWLWNWGLQNDADTEFGEGPLGKIKKSTFEEEMLKAFIDTSVEEVDPVQNTDFLGGLEEKELSFPFVITEQDAERNDLHASRVEQIILEKAMEAYDAASNGNKTRGGVKKASDIVNAFRPHLKDSVQLQQAIALISATHALSFYSLTLQHGVPFQPVSIRVSHDSISLIEKVLEQNQRSYTKLDDLISIAKNLVSAGLIQTNGKNTAETWQSDNTSGDLTRKMKDTERRVTFMAIEAALREDDFETAYSYIVNRLTPSGTDVTTSSMPTAGRRSQGHTKMPSLGRMQVEDDISWRAAFLAGRYRPAASSSPTLRRLEQRTELLSLALLLAPTSALTDILGAWRRCEEEMTTLQLAQQQAEQEFDDRADKRLSGGGSSALPGNFTVHDEQPPLILNQARREVGRMGVAGRANDDTPLSMFDLTRNAARAFSKNAFPLHDAARTSEDGGAREGSRMRDSVGSIGDLGGDTDATGRVRKRDIVANAVSGGLASGLGWVLGAKPVNEQEP